MTRRAELVDATRQRIVEAAVQLHGTVGPARTTIAGVAETAGVTRLTVYRHFADDAALFAACSAHWAAQQVPPDPQSWLAVDDPVERVRRALGDLYRFYRDGADMLTRVHRDRDALPAALQEELDSTEAQFADLLLSGFRLRGGRRSRLRAVLGHAVAFSTWQSLCGVQRADDEDAVAAMVLLVAAVARADA